MTIFRFTLLKGLKNPLTLIFNCILPIGLVLIRPIWAGNARLGYTLIIMLMWGGAYLMSLGILSDKTSGTIVRILAAPVTMFDYLSQSLLAFMMPLIIQILLLSVVGAILYNWTLTFFLALALCYIIFTISAVAMGFAWNCLFKDREQSSSIFLALITFGSFLSGALFPLELFPQPLQYVGAILPAFWAVRGINDLLDYGIVSNYWIALLIMLLLAIIFLFYGGKRKLI